MKDQIIARIKAKYPNINLSKARLDAIADKLKVTEDSEIDGKLDELNDIFPFAEIARQDDRVRTLEKKDPKPTDPPAPTDPKPTDPPKPDGGVPAWAQLLIDQNKELAGKISAIENGKSTETRKSRLDDVLKDASDSYKALVLKDFGRIAFKDDAEFDTYLEEKKADSAEFVQTETNTVLGKITPPVKSNGQVPKTASKEQVDSVLKNIL